MSREYLLSENGMDFKANLHCHTNMSDGSRTPEEVKKHYMDRGYSIIAYTDHDVFVPRNELCDDKFVALNGFEAEFNASDESRWWHTRTTHLCMIALDQNIRYQPGFHREKYIPYHSEDNRKVIEFDENEPDFEREYTPENINRFIKICKEKNFFVTYNHPMWSLETLNEYSKLEGMDALEIMNGGGFVCGFHDICPNSYDELLRTGHNIYAIGGDDNHSIFDCCWAWTMIRAEKLTYESVVESLKAGNFYASNGPMIKNLYIEDGKLFAETSEAKYIRFSTGQRHAKLIYNEDGSPVTEGSFELDIENDDYVRVTVFGMDGTQAFSNAHILKRN